MSSLPHATQVSAGGVAYRVERNQIEVALILVGPNARWQLPKGTPNLGEKNEETALREVNEEAGIKTEIISHIDKIEYWFYARQDGQRTRIHKFVHFYLMRYLSGNVEDHDYEVEEARWIEIHQAIQMLAFESERKIVQKALEQIQNILDDNSLDSIRPGKKD